MNAQNIWTVERGGLKWRGADWWSASWLAELLNGEDVDRISVEDVQMLLVQIGRSE